MSGTTGSRIIMGPRTTARAVVRRGRSFATRISSLIKRIRNKVAKDLLTSLPEWCRRAVLATVPEALGIRQMFIAASFHVDPVAANAAFHKFNEGAPDFADNYDRALIERAVEFGYLSWPRKIHKYVQGKSILDVGCGTGLHGIGYIVAGAKSYTGLDPKVNLDSDWSKNHLSGQYEHFGATALEIMQRMPRVRLVSGTFEDIAPDEKFDLVVLHNVTEHLLNIESVFAGIRDRLKPGGKLLYHHHNFYCWNGHHLPPRSVDKIDLSDPAQRELIDWNHLTFDPPEGHYISYGLNKIRLDELKELTEGMFDLEEWEEILPVENTGLGRLTPEILARHPQYTERELSVKNVLCVASQKGQGRRGGGDGKEQKPSSRERDMRRDEVFMSFYERCKPYTMTTMERLYGLYRAVEYVQHRGLEGDIVECGVWRGGSMMMIALSLMNLGESDRDLYLFDTYEGMPEPSDKDFKFGEDPAHEKWQKLKQDGGSSWNYASVEEVREAMLSTGYPAERIHFVQGMVEDTLPGLAPARISLLRLDTDFYESTKHEFLHLYPRLAQHGVLIIDDFGTWAGSAQATQEYFDDNGIVMLLSRLDAGGRIGVKEGPANWQG